jgi:hypothetical protein
MVFLMALTACDGGLAGGDLEYSELGSFEGDTGFATDIEFEVPEGATSVLVHCGEFGDQKLGLLWNLRKPDGSLLYDGEAPGSTTRFRSEAHDDLVPFLIPLAPETSLDAGVWSADVFVGTGGQPITVDCGMLVRSSAEGAKATLSLEFVWVGTDLDASSAPGDAGFQAMLAEIERAWATAGFSLEASHSDFGGDVATYSVVDVTEDDFSEFNDLLRTADPEDTLTLTVFMVEEISSSGNTILGKAGGPPGLATYSGTSKSGMVVTTLDLADDPAYVGRIAAHEAGHFLGLFHTTEADPALDLHDPISDTPQCPASADANANGQLNTSECAGSGAENVMWWTNNTDATGADFSSDQGTILRKNPLAQ